MRYAERDRCPIVDFSFWEETIPEWHSQGLPGHVQISSTDEFFGMDSLGESAPIHNSLFPGFEEIVLEDLGEEVIKRDWEGVTYRTQKTMRSIPLYLDHTLKDRESWEKEFLHRLDPNAVGRVGTDFAKKLPALNSPDQSRLVTVSGGSLYGWIRDWMGVEGASYLVYDDPDLFEEIVETLTALQVEVLQQVFASGLKVDVCTMWEDMCYSGGPLLTPSVFNRLLIPRYRRITDVLRANGVDFTWIDCDGKIDELIPGWLEAGINIMFPIEVGTWGGDPVAMRKKFGKDLRLMGGFSKHVLTKGPKEIAAEVDRLTPLVEEGGFIPMPDHRVPPDVPYSHYLFYLLTIRERWGLGINLHPAPALQEVTR
ncbi:MAG: hypothetical protein MUC92_06300 [Fimbriimonadaceae bacterium]|jgi:uroporphyrinogen decarboxylase|nr:hypothetical protein [Fimbriimonadaceae bacterium]